MGSPGTPLAEQAQRRETAEERERPAHEARERERQVKELTDLIDQRVEAARVVHDEALRDELGKVVACERLARDAENAEDVARACSALSEKFEEKIAELETRVTSQQAFDREPLVRIEDSVGRIRAEAQAEFEAKLVEHERSFEAKIAALEERLRATTGALPQARDWVPQTVCYKGALFSCDGALWQARCDTATAPGGPDWTLIAARGVDGRDGRDGREICWRGGYAMDDSYARLDVVIFGGEPFIATRDNPGACPGDGWQLLAPRGPRGATGPRGHKGNRGQTEPPVEIRSWLVDAARYRATPCLSNATVGAPLELRPLFELYQMQTTSE